MNETTSFTQKGMGISWNRHFALWGAHRTLAKDLKASVAYIPLLAESPEKGAFVELVKAIDEVYTDGTISINIYPMPRSINNVVTGKADFHVPMMRSPYVSLDDKPFQFASQRMGTVCFVIYSHTEHPITKDAIVEATSEQPLKHAEPASQLSEVLNVMKDEGLIERYQQMSLEATSGAK